MSNLTIYEDGYYAQDPIRGGGASSVTVGGGTQVPDAPRGTSQVSNVIPENPNVISEPRPRETYEPLGSDPKPPKGTSAIAEPDLGTSPTSPTGTTTTTPTGTTTTLPSGSAMGGGGAMGGGVGSGSADKLVDKKPFPYWILIAGLVGGYLIFREK